MRTTIDIDDDLLRALRDRAQRERTSLRDVVNAVLKRGSQSTRERVARQRYRCPEFPMGRPASSLANLDKALALAAELEDGESLRDLDLRK